MKFRSFIGAFLFLALAACHRPVETCHGASLTSELVSIDSIMQSRPDSALALLQASPKVDPYYQLLLSEALYKNDSAQLNRPELLEAMAYYDSLGCPFLSARCHYMNGVGYYEMDSVVEACEQYLKALEIMEEQYEEKDLVGYKAKFMALTYNRLGSLFSEQFMMQLSTYCLEQSLKFCLIEPTSPQGLSKTLYQIGKQYDKMDELDKARSYYLLAIKKAPNCNTLFYRDVLSSTALCDYQMGRGSNHSLIVLRQILAQAVDEDEKLTRRFIIGAIYYDEGLYDSALYYLEPVFVKEETTLRNIQVAEYLRVIYDNLGFGERSDECSRYLVANKCSEGVSKALVSRLEAVYQDYLMQKQDRQAAKLRGKEIQHIFILAAPIILITVLVIIIFTRYRGKKMMETQQLDAERVLREKQRQLEKEKNARQRDIEKHRQDILQKEEHLRMLESALNHQRTEANLRRQAFLQEAVCVRINDSVRNQHITARNSSRKSVPFSESDAVELGKAILTHYNDFESLLLGKYPKMSKDDLQLCQLYLLGLDERQIAVIQCKSYSAIKKRANTLKELLGINESLSSYILKF
ncbi:MAG: hypothetical protein J6W26_05255 [Bacteroidales bacterium]|nr:hypothetical protein [Bacteroidales bacterium]